MHICIYTHSAEASFIAIILKAIRCWFSNKQFYPSFLRMLVKVHIKVHYLSYLVKGVQWCKIPFYMQNILLFQSIKENEFHSRDHGLRSRMRQL